jgi:fatty-acyl-CoA synthase
VQPEGDSAVRVTVPASADAAALAARLRAVLAPLPLTVHVGEAAGNPQTP